MSTYPSPTSSLFGSVAHDGLKVAGALGLLFFAPLLFVVAALGGQPSGAQSSAAAAAIAEIPPEQLAVMEQVGATTGLPWQVLAAIAKLGSDFGANMGTGPAGTMGYCQLTPAAWAQYGVDGNGDGSADPADFHDCLPATAALLLANGAPADLRQALLSYNSSPAFVDQVLGVAGTYGYLDPAGIPAQAVALARSRIGLPYIWGATGPGSFDCSGLTQWVYAQLGASLPRTAQAQYDSLAPVAMNALQPGDLVFYEYTYPSSDRVTHVGIYEGGGMVVMATQPGAFVEEVPLADSYWAGHFAGAGRPTAGLSA